MRAERPIGLWLLGGITMALLYLPLVVLVVLSFNDARLAVSWHGLTLKWYGRLWQDQPLWASVLVSLKVAGYSTVLATGIGLAGALALERRWRPDVEALMMLPLVIPEIMMGVGLMLLFALVKLPLGLGTVTLAHAAFNAPLVMVLIRARLRKLDRSLEEAAQDLGATPWQVFRWVTLPLLKPAIVGAALLAATVSFDDFLVTFFTTGPGATTLPLRVYSTIRSGLTPELNALSSIMVVVSMGLVGVAILLQRARTTAC